MITASARAAPEAQGREAPSHYWVWFDTLLEEHFWIEEGAVASAFLSKLRREGIHAQLVEAVSPAAALEHAFPHRKNTQQASPRVH